MRLTADPAPRRVAVAAAPSPAVSLGGRLDWPLWLAVLLGLALRLGVAWASTWQAPESALRLHGDEPELDYLARTLLAGGGAGLSAHQPLYPALLAGLYALLGPSPRTVVFVQAGLAGLVVPLVYLVARRLAARRVALLAAWLAACYPALWRLPERLDVNALCLPLLLLAVLALLAARDRPSAARFAGFGLLAGLLALARADGVALALAALPLLAGAGWRRAVIRLTAMLAGVSAVLAPWTLYLALTSGVVAPLGLPGAAIWQGSPEYARLEPGGLAYWSFWFAQFDPSQNGGHDPRTAAGSGWFAARGLHAIAADPLGYLGAMLRRAVFFWFGHPAHEWEWPLDPAVIRGYYPAWYELAGFWLARLTPLVALGALWLGRWRRRDLAPLAWVAASLMLPALLGVAEARASLALQPLLLIPIAMVGVEVAGRRLGASGAAAGPASVSGPREARVKRPAIPALTGLRFFAALAVVLVHYEQVTPYPPLVHTVLSDGNAAVSLFFILSGFVLVYNYGEWFGGSFARLGEFVLARFARLYPLYLVTLLLVTPLTLQTDWLTLVAGDRVFTSWLLNLAMLQPWVADETAHIWNVPSWSIGNELFFYLTFPFFVRWVLARCHGPVRLMVLALALYLGNALFIAALPGLLEALAGPKLWNVSGYARYLLPLSRAAEFWLGCVVGGLLLLPGRVAPPFGLGEARWRHVALALAFAGAALALAFGPWATLPDPGGLLRKYLVYVPAFVVLIAALAAGRTVLDRLLALPVVVLLGEASYSLYLIHWLGVVAWKLVLGEHNPLPWPLVGLSVLATVALSVVGYYAIERPGRRLILSLARPASPASTPGLAPAAD